MFKSNRPELPKKRKRGLQRRLGQEQQKHKRYKQLWAEITAIRYSLHMHCLNFLMTSKMNMMEVTQKDESSTLEVEDEYNSSWNNELDIQWTQLYY